jgi:hypothetical protein
VSIDSAIKQLDEQIESYAHGTLHEPDHGTDGWFLLRALDVGRCFLLRLKQLDAHGDEGAAERFYNQCAKMSKNSAVPEPVVVPRETAV